MHIKKTTSPMDAISLFRRLQKEQSHAFILDSSSQDDFLGRYSFVGAEPFLTFASKGAACTVTSRNGQQQTLTGDPLVFLQELWQQYAHPSAASLPFVGGAVGYFGYDLCHFLAKLPRRALDDTGINDCFFGFYDGIYAFDHHTNTLSLVALGLAAQAADAITKLEKDLLRFSQIPPADGPPPQVGPIQANMNKDVYLKAVKRIKEYIRQGDIYQANFTQRFSCSFEGDPVTFYTALRQTNPAPFSACLDTKGCFIASSSPERFLRIEKDRVETRPIKGTAARSASPAEDEKNRLTLLASEKDRAELLMIVDLERNDLSRIARKGSVQVGELFTIESYSTVHHLIANVSARIRPECTAMDCIRAAFPGGSITGAPKIRAMEVIDELEPTQRNVYTGAIGYWGFNGSLDLNIAIRTVVIKDQTAYFQVGGGIVWDSHAESEYQESLLKAKALLEALGTGGSYADLAKW